MIVSLELTLVWGNSRASRGSSASCTPEPEAQTQIFKLVIPPVLLQRGTAAQPLWEGLFGHPDLQGIWNQWEQLAKCAQRVMTVVETDAAGVNDRVFAGGVVAFRILTIFIAIHCHPKSFAQIICPNGGISDWQAIGIDDLQFGGSVAVSVFFFAVFTGQSTVGVHRYAPDRTAEGAADSFPLPVAPMPIGGGALASNSRPEASVAAVLTIKLPPRHGRFRQYAGKLAQSH